MKQRRMPDSSSKYVEEISKATTPEDSTPEPFKALPSNAYVRSFIVVSIILGISTFLLYFSSLSTFPTSSSLTHPPLILALTLILSYLINWFVFFAQALPNETEKYFDLTGSITYITLTIFSLTLGAIPVEPATEYKLNPRPLIQSVFVILWAMRLGSFLYGRIKRSGNVDGRFDLIRINPPRFFSVFTLQGLWVILTALPVFIVNCYGGANQPDEDYSDLSIVDYIGYGIWAVGFAIEVVADRQKSVFAADPSNKGKWIEVGLWSYSRHPNYFGEMLLWFGQFVASTSLLKNGQWVCVLSPMFVYVLLMKISGVPGLEKRGDEKFAGMQGYVDYKKRTSLVVIMPHRKV